MSLLRLLKGFRHARWLGGAGRGMGRVAAALVLAVGFAQAGTAPSLAAPTAVAPSAPQVSCGLVLNNSDHDADSLRWAVGCVPAGGTVTFSSNLAGETIRLTTGEIAINQTVTIDGSNAPGVIVDAENNSRVFNITASGLVTLQALTLQHGCCAVGGAVFDNVSQPLVLNSVRVLSSTVVGGTGGGLFADGPLTLINSDFISDTSTSNGGGAVAGGAAVVTGGRFERDRCTTAGCEGGALFGFAGLTVSGTQFISNTSLFHGGAAFTEANAGLTDGTFQNNQCTQSSSGGCQGGGLYASNALALTGTQFISNTSTSGGGGAAAGDVTLTNGLFQGNRCTGACLGGGLLVNATLTATGTRFISNTSDGLGGGLLALTASLTNTQFISNTSFTAAGGAWVDGLAALTNGLFEQNQCTSGSCQGGGLNTDDLTLTGTQFMSNTSAGDGGGAFVNAAPILIQGRFQGNRCTDSTCQGGGLYTKDNLILASTDFISNTSAGDGGGAYALGGAVLANGRFELNKCADDNCLGGGLYVSPTLTLSGTQFISNTSAGSGGGAFVVNAAAVANGRFEQNKCTGIGCAGGGLWANDANMIGTQFIGNKSSGDAGGAWVENVAEVTGGGFQQNQCTGSGCQGGGLNTGPLFLIGTQFSGNQSGGDGGGLAVFADSELITSLFQDNQCTGGGCLGGGLYAESSVAVLGSSFSGNQSAGGGGLAITNKGLLAPAQGPSGRNGCAGCAGGNQPAGPLPGGAILTLANVTLSGNAATVSGGGLSVGQASQAQLLNVTVADNQAPSGGGMAVAALTTTVSISNTLISNNGADNCAGTIGAGTHNLEFPGSTCATAGPSAGFSTANPLLEPLALNPPGTTLTQALLMGSPARDAGDPSVCAGPQVNNVDQRGVTRPIRGLIGTGPAICDIGAFEAGPPALFLPLALR